MEGWIKLHRKLLEWEWYTDVNTKVVFIHCLLRANIADTEWRGTRILKGQFFTSNQSLSNELGLSIKEIRNSLKKLEKTGELTLFGASNGTMITVCKYESYQQIEESKGKRWASDGQARGKRGATDKEEEEEREEQEEDLLGYKPPKKPKKQFTIPTLEEIQAYCLERKNTINPQYFYDYYEVRGWIPKNSKQQMKDWKAAVRTWEKNDQTPKPPTQPLVKTPEQIFKENRKKLEYEQKARAEFKFDE